MLKWLGFAFLLTVAANTNAAVFTNVTLPVSARVHAESWVFDATQQVFVPVVPKTDLLLTANGSLDAGSGTTASVSATVDSLGSTITGQCTATGIHGGGGLGITNDMYNYYDNFGAQSEFDITFNLAVPTLVHITTNRSASLSGPGFFGLFPTVGTEIDFPAGSQTQDITLAAGQWLLGGSVGLYEQNAPPAGITLPGGFASVSLTVPEPSTALILMALSPACLLRRKRRTQ